MKHFALITLFALSGCGLGGPDGMSLAFSTTSGNPVVVTAFRVNGQDVLLQPTETYGTADVSRPRIGAGQMSLGYPKGNDAKTMQIDATWVELLTQKAWQAQVDVPLDQLQQIPSNRVEYMPVFGASGHLLITSDPLPTADSAPINDVASACGTRRAEADTDFAENPGALPGLAEALAFAYPAPAPSPCPEA